MSYLKPPSLSLDEIQAPIAAELLQFEKHFYAALKSRVMLLDKIMQYIMKTKGKQMRPMFVLLSASVCGNIQPATYRAAALIELLHTATLVHDDVVDEADKRRGFFSINALWKNKVAVLIGDYLLSRGLLMAIEANDFNLLKIVSEAVRLMSEGELLQLQKSRTMNIDEPIYFEIIRQKTASLIASCCACGAASTSEDPQIQSLMHDFGEKVGIAFQIKDDLLDYTGAHTGKPQGIDIKERKLTLPLIHTLNKASWTERKKLLNIVKYHNTNAEKVQWLMQHVAQAGGLKYSEQIMNQYIEEAMNLLHQLPPSNSRQTLEQLVMYSIGRNK